MKKRLFKNWVRYGIKDKQSQRDKHYFLEIGNPKKEHQDSNKTLDIRFYPSWHKLSFKYNYAGYFDNRPEIQMSFGWGWLIITLPFKTKYDECEPPWFGFYFYESCFWYCFGNRKTKCIHLPWDYDWVRTSVLLKDQTWEHETKGDRKNFYEDHWKEKIWIGRYGYTYTLKNGTVQERLATVKVEEREWRMRWLKWTKMFAKIRKSIDVNFSDEIGERSGSYKGGTIGCGYDILPKESPLACLRRMERERTF